MTLGVWSDDADQSGADQKEKSDKILVKIRVLRTTTEVLSTVEQLKMLAHIRAQHKKVRQKVTPTAVTQGKEYQLGSN